MHKIFFSIALLFVTYFVFAQQKETTNLEDYKLVWADEFNKDGIPDTTKWRFETGYMRNNEAQWYQKENAVCKNGNLIITGKKETKDNPNFIEGSKDWKTKWQKIKYTSASVVMKKEHAFKYGKVEVRAKIDAQTGLWPAIWTLGVESEWPSNGEVDILEYYDNSILANYAYAGKQRYKAIWDVVKKPIDSMGKKNWATDFHVWKLLWTEKLMQIFVDDILLNEISLEKTINKSDGKNPFHQSHVLLLNLALGGNRGGSLVNTNLPSIYLIDYVRIYQKK
jgi:beta-glucanase (GH16 family)